MRISPQLCCPILTLLEAGNSILFGKKIKRFVAVRRFATVSTFHHDEVMTMMTTTTL